MFRISKVMSQLISILGLLSIGSLLTVLSQHLLNIGVRSADRLFAERKEAFVGFLTAYTDLGQGITREREGAFAYWDVRVQLVASQNVLNALNTLQNTKRDSEERLQAHNNLVKTMRQDLRIVK